MLFQQITTLSLMISGKHFRKLFSKEEAVSPESNLFIPLFAGRNITGLKLGQTAGDSIGMLNRYLPLLIVSGDIMKIWQGIGESFINNNLPSC